MVNLRQDIYDYARSAEQEKSFKKAAVGWFTLSVFEIASENYQNTPAYRQGLTYCLRSQYCDFEAGNIDRAQITGSFLRQHTDPLLQEENQPVIAGFGYEWCGDSYLLVGDSKAREYYQKAKAKFEQLDFETQLHWGARPEYDTPLGVMQKFCDYHNEDISRHSDIDFAERVEWKLELSARLIKD